MARNVKVFISCDMCSEELDENDPSITHRFGYEGRNYELDLCDRHASEFVGDMVKYQTAGTVVEQRQRAPRAAKPAGSKPNSKPKPNATVREWANANGYNLGVRGRIPADVQAAFEAAKLAGEPEIPAMPGPLTAEELSVADQVPASSTYVDMWEQEDDQGPAMPAVRNPDGTLAGS